MSDSFYRTGRFLLDQSIRLYYRRIELSGGERIPSRGAAIVVANHPNSVADAFLLASQLTARKINFIAKDSITQAPLIGWIARQFGVVGVARAMDYERQRDLARQRNDLAIGTCVPRLLAGEIVAIFGEGISTDARHLQMIRKGAMRFGTAAERAAGFGLGLLWIPVGISYSAKHRFRSDVLIRVGKSFTLADLCESHGLDPATQENEVIQHGTAHLQQELESLVVNIEQEELAGLIDTLVEFFGTPPSSLAGRHDRHRRVARAVQYFNVAEPQRVADLEQVLRRYHERLATAGLTDEVVRQRHPTSQLWVHLLGLLRSSLLMVLNLYGWANSLVPRWGAYLSGGLGHRSFLSERREARSVEPMERVMRAKEALWGTYGGWVGAALAFPVQIYLVYRWAASRSGIEVGMMAALLYGLSLIPSWRLYSRRRDILRDHYASFRHALEFLLHAEAATRLRARRQQVQRRLRTLLAVYDAEAPRAA